jgi:hypothetical protein
MTNQDVVSSLKIDREQVIKLLEESVQGWHYIQENLNRLKSPLDIIQTEFNIWDEYNEFTLSKISGLSQIIKEYYNEQSDIYVEDICYPPSEYELLQRMNCKIQHKLDKVYLLIKVFHEGI